ncbi:unnamed protein product [Closterium sp. NIES-53]
MSLTPPLSLDHTLFLLPLTPCSSCSPRTTHALCLPLLLLLPWSLPSHAQTSYAFLGSVYASRCPLRGSLLALPYVAPLPQVALYPCAAPAYHTCDKHAHLPLRSQIQFPSPIHRAASHVPPSVPPSLSSSLPRPQVPFSPSTLLAIPFSLPYDAHFLPAVGPPCSRAAFPPFLACFAHFSPGDPFPPPAQATSVRQSFLASSSCTSPAAQASGTPWPSCAGGGHLHVAQPRRDLLLPACGTPCHSHTFLPTHRASVRGLLRLRHVHPHPWPLPLQVSPRRSAPLGHLHRRPRRPRLTTLTGHAHQFPRGAGRPRGDSADSKDRSAWLVTWELTQRNVQAHLLRADFFQASPDLRGTLPYAASVPAISRALESAFCAALQDLVDCRAGAGGVRAGGAGAGGAGTGDAGAGGTGPGDPGDGGAGAGDLGAGGAGAGGSGAGGSGAGGTMQRRPFFVPPPPSSLPPPHLVLGHVLSLLSSTGLTPSLLCLPPHPSQPQLQPDSPLPAPSPYAEQTDSLTERCEPESRASSVRAVRTGHRVPRPRPPPVPGTHIMALHPSSVPLRVPLPSPPASSLSTAASALVAELVHFSAVGRLDYAASLVAKSEQEDFECLAPAVSHLVAMMFAHEGDPDAPDIPTPNSYARAITGPYSSQWQTAMDAEMASWKSTGTYIDAVPPSGANIVDDMWIFRVKRPPGSPPIFKARYVARGFGQRQGVEFFQTFSPTRKMTTLRVLLHIAAQRDYELHSFDISTTFLQGSLHEEIWLRRPPGFTGSFPAGTQWSLRRPVYGLRQAPREWHDTLRTTLAALGFAPSTPDPSLFLRTDTSLPPFYVLVYVDDLVFATADTEALALVKSELQKRHTCTDLGPSALRLPILLATVHSSAYRSLALSSTFGRVLLRAWGSCFEDGVQLSSLDTSWVDDLATQRSSQGYTFSLGSGSVSWRSTRSSSILSSSCEAEIYARAMAAQELRRLTYLLTDLGERPPSSLVLYVDNKAMIALCQEHRTKHIALRYFLARELHQRGQLRLAYVATRANTADIFTKALQSGDH